MDENVIRSLIKWPNVPDCFGWLALDRRGQWRMRDEYVQANHLPGSVIEHVALNDFISRNYACDKLGRYFFQNGPQRVFITLDATPWIARISPANSSLQFLTQCDSLIHPQGALSDELGNIYITGHLNQTLYQASNQEAFFKQDGQSVALLLDHDLGLFTDLAQIQEQSGHFVGSWNWNGQELPIDPIHSTELSQRFHYMQSPCINPAASSPAL